jgi:chloramphenicol-sensitive protein RarD
VAAYGMWGLLPLYWPLLEPASPVEILAHRVVWSVLFVVVLVALLRGRAWLRQVSRRRFVLLGVASVLLTANWGLYIYAVNSERVVETSLGYFINPLVTVALGVLVLKESLTGAQRVALTIAAGAVLVLTLDYGHPPWIALALAFSFATYGLIKKHVDLDGMESLAIETVVVALPALAYLLWLGSAGQGTFTTGGAGHALLLMGAGVATAVPLVCFGAAAVRIPLVTLGLLQFLAPLLQFAIGVLIRHEPMPPGRIVGFALVWVAICVFAADGLRRNRAAVAPVPAG